MPKKKAAQPKSFISPLLYYFGLGFITTFCVGISLVNLNVFLDKQKVLGVSAQTIPSISTTDLLKEKEFWTNLVNQNPTYRDGYVELSDIQYKLGNIEVAQIMLQKAIALDPNSSFLASLQKKYQ